MDDEGKELGMSRAAGQMGRSVLYMGRFEHTGVSKISISPRRIIFLKRTTSWINDGFRV